MPIQLTMKNNMLKLRMKMTMKNNMLKLRKKMKMKRTQLMNQKMMDPRADPNEDRNLGTYLR